MFASSVCLDECRTRNAIEKQHMPGSAWEMTSWLLPWFVTCGVCWLIEGQQPRIG